MCYMSQVSRKNEKTSFQNMADLPIGRCTEVPPFTYCGVDMFVPYLISEKRSQLKRHGALITCLTCRSYM